MSDGWRNVTAKEPCPICKRPQWCRHGDKGTNCMRLANDKPLKNGGWFYPYDAKVISTPINRAPEPVRLIDAAALMSRWTQDTQIEWVEKFAAKLGVAYEALYSLECAWAASHQSWAFPMKDGAGKTIGIRLRSLDGKKFAVKGSHQGLFIPNLPPQRTVYLAEGPTSTAALISLGLFSIGRPACSGGCDHVRVALRRLGVQRVVIVADNDGAKRANGHKFYPGQQGAEKLSDELSMPCRVWMPMTKDVRDLVRLGATAALIESEINNLVWKR